MNPKASKRGVALSVFIWFFFLAHSDSSAGGEFFALRSDRHRSRRRRSKRQSCRQEFSHGSIDGGANRFRRPLQRAHLTPGDYELAVSSEGYSTNNVKVTVAAGAGKIAVNLSCHIGGEARRWKGQFIL